MVAAEKRIIPAPPVSPVPYTLMSVSDVRDGQPRVLFGVQYPTDACVTTTEAPEWCPATPPDPVPVKTPHDGVFYSESVQFSVYSLLRCRMVGADMQEERATRVLQLNEARGVEQGFMTHFLSAPTDADVGTIAAVDLTPVADTPVCPELGLALLESYARQHYGSVPVIHAGATVASLLGSRNQIVSDRAMLLTRIGSRVTASGGYDLVNLGPGTEPVIPEDPEDPIVPGEPGVAPPAGATWMYVTGQVSIMRSDPFAAGPVLGQAAPGGLYNNEFDVMAERSYAAMAECIKAAVLVSVDCGEVPAP